MKKLLVSLVITLASHLYAQVPATFAGCPTSGITGLTTDGPAALPKTCQSNTINSSTLVQVKDMASFTKAMKCGVTLVMAPGIYALPVSGIKYPSCTKGNEFHVKISGSAFPSTGTRITTVTPSAKFIVTGAAPVAGSYNVFGPGVEFDSPGVGHTSLLLDLGSSSHIIINRTLFRGGATDEVAHGINTAGANYVNISDSYFDGFKCIAVTGQCTDASAIYGGIGPNVSQAVTIDNNYIEASGEGIIFGGATSSGPPTDIIITRNHLVKPLKWMPGSSNFIGVNFVAKNCMELKNAVRVLMEANICENSWGGFSQNGYTIVLTPKNQAGKDPTAVVQDVTIRYNSLKGGSGLLIATSTSDPPLHASSMGMTKLSIHDDLVIVDSEYKATGDGIQLTNQDAVLDQVSISRVTVVGATHSAFILGANKSQSLAVVNSIFYPGIYGVTGTGGGSTACSYALNGKPLAMFSSCWTNLLWNNNIVVGGKPLWPMGTGYSSPLISVNAGDFHSVAPGVGADIDMLNKILKGVQ